MFLCDFATLISTDNFQNMDIDIDMEMDMDIDIDMDIDKNTGTYMDKFIDIKKK
jgi:hypothetical protein